MIRRVGRGLRWTAALHAVFGLWFYADPVLATLQDGLVAAVDPHVDRRLAFWFLLYSPVLWILGDEFDHGLEAGQLPLLRRLTRLLVGMGGVGAALMPVSGFWLVLGLGMLAWLGLQRPFQQLDVSP